MKDISIVKKIKSTIIELNFKIEFIWLFYIISFQKWYAFNANLNASNKSEFTYFYYSSIYHCLCPTIIYSILSVV